MPGCLLTGSARTAAPLASSTVSATFALGGTSLIVYAMCGPGFEPDVTLALPQASIAVMGPEAAVNAVYYNKIQEKPEAERSAYVEQLREEYRQDIDIYKLASENHIDAVIAGDDLRDELIRRFKVYASKGVRLYPKRRSVIPV